MIKISLFPGYALLFGGLVLLGNRHRAELRQREGLPPSPTLGPMWLLRYDWLAADLAFATLTAVFLIFPLQARDWLGATFLLLGEAALLVATPLLLRGRMRQHRFLLMVILPLLSAGWIMLLFNWRLYGWLAGLFGTDPGLLERAHRPGFRWILNGYGLVPPLSIQSAIALAQWLSPRARQASAVPESM